MRDIDGLRAESRAGTEWSFLRLIEALRRYEEADRVRRYGSPQTSNHDASGSQSAGALLTVRSSEPNTGKECRRCRSQPGGSNAADQTGRGGSTSSMPMAT